MIEIPLTQGKVALVDDSDDWVAKLKWYYHPRGCAVRTTMIRKIYMHRLIMGAPDGVQVDHINHDKLDNRRANLRLVTTAQNQMNRTKKDNCSSRYKGVSWNSRDKKWQAHIKLNYKTKYLGLFDSELDAARAYDRAAREHFGEYALLNERELA